MIRSSRITIHRSLSAKMIAMNIGDQDQVRCGHALIHFRSTLRISIDGLLVKSENEARVIERLIHQLFALKA